MTTKMDDLQVAVEDASAALAAGELDMAQVTEVYIDAIDTLRQAEIAYAKSPTDEAKTAVDAAQTTYDSASANWETKRAEYHDEK